MLTATKKLSSPYNESELQFLDFISQLEVNLRGDNKLIPHQLLCRTVRVALGMKADSKSYPNEFAFYVSIKDTIGFIGKWKKAIYDLGKLRYSFNYLASVIARTLYYMDFAELLLTFELYEKLKKDEWVFNKKIVMKPRGFNPQTFFNGPCTGRRRQDRCIYFVMPRVLEYGSTSQSFWVGESYTAATTTENKDRYYLIHPSSQGIRSSVRRTWGDTPVDAVLWLVADNVVESGAQAWNAHVRATDIKLDKFEARDEYYKANSCIDKWKDSKQLKELKQQALAHYC